MGTRKHNHNNHNKVAEALLAQNKVRTKFPKEISVGSERAWRPTGVSWRLPPLTRYNEASKIMNFFAKYNQYNKT